MSNEDRDYVSNLLTRHALTRMHARRISTTGVVAVLNFGREVHTRGAVVYAIGRNEVENAKRAVVDLRAHEGLHVVCSKDGSILTVYRNRRLSDLRPRRRGRSYRFLMNAAQMKPSRKRDEFPLAA